MRLSIDDIELTRIGYREMAIPAELFGLQASQFAEVPWREPWVDGEQVRLGVAAWCVESAGQRVVIDPLQTSDLLLRTDAATETAHQDAVEQAFAAAGWPVDSVDQVLVSHVEDVGMLARRDADGAWQPFFPQAMVRLSQPEIDNLRRLLQDVPEEPAAQTVAAAWRMLLARDRVRSFADAEELIPRLLAEITAGHQAGHAAFTLLDARGQAALSFVGHLALSPLHLVTGLCPTINEDPSRALSELHRLAADGRLLAGPLWPRPAVGRFDQAGQVFVTDLSG